MKGTSAYLTADAGPGEGGRVLSTTVGPRLYTASSPDCEESTDGESVAVVLGTGKTEGNPSAGSFAENDARGCASGAKEVLATRSGSMKAVMQNALFMVRTFSS